MEYAWYVLATTPVHRIEFEVANRLNQMERATMVPFEDKAIKRKGNRYPLKIVRFPLFTRYVFVQLPTHAVRHEYHILKGIEGVQGLVSASRHDFAPMRLNEETVGFVRGLSDRGWGKGATATTIHKAFQPGMEVKVIDGPFYGMRAKVDTVTRKRISLMIQLFGSSRLVEFDPEQLAVA